MSTIAVLSDIHGNIEALNAVLYDLNSFSCETVLCAGDLVGYGPHPNEVIQKIKELKIQTVMGNYDEAVGFKLPVCGCHIDNPRQKQLSLHSLKWSVAHTTAENREFLRSLPESLSLNIHGKTLIMMHSSYDSVNEYIYQEDTERIDQILQQTPEDIFIYGHTHFPYVKFLRSKYIINAGSVGRPKDGDNRASYILLNIQNDQLQTEIRRVTYNIGKVISDIEKNGLDASFGDFLCSGGDKQTEKSLGNSCRFK